jgi:hypothetical protein
VGAAVVVEDTVGADMVPTGTRECHRNERREPVPAINDLSIDSDDRARG